MWDVYFNEAGWKSICQELPKCKTLNSLEFSSIGWWSSNKKEVAASEFAVKFAQLLKYCPNILFTNETEFFCDDDDDDDDYDDNVLYQTHFSPIPEHNRLTKNMITLRKKENYQVRSFLVAEAVGTRFAKKPSSCYTVIKANVDVLVAYL